MALLTGLRQAPEKKMGKGFCIWLTGLSASGKTTLARLLENALKDRGFKVEVLDGDEIRANLNQELGFSRRDREINLNRIAYITKLLVRHGVVVIVAAISPYESIRQQVRARVEDYVEVFLNCPLSVCMHRDPKGLYRKALAGEIKNFTGIDDPFEIPKGAEIELKPHRDSPGQCLELILYSLERLKCIPSVSMKILSEPQDDMADMSRLSL